MSGFNSAAVREYLIELQDLIVDRLEQVDGRKFLRDSWDRPEGGGGRSCILEEGNVLERGGVAFSHVMGDKMPPSATAHRPELAGRRWEAMGVSLVFHPRNPYAPTVHMNVRMFVAMKDGTAPVFWFGGGMDLTPYYGFEEDAAHFHRVNRDALQPFGDDKTGRPHLGDLGLRLQFDGGVPPAHEQVYASRAGSVASTSAAMARSVTSSTVPIASTTTNCPRPL